MGVSSPGLFGDDVACEIRDDYVALLRSGLTGTQATKKLLADRSEELADVDDGPVVWLALAVTQWKYGRLEPRVKSRALSIIKTGKDLARWRETGDPAPVRQRQRVLDKVRAQLESPQPGLKRIREQKKGERGLDNRQTPQAKKIQRGNWREGNIVAIPVDNLFAYAKVHRSYNIGIYRILSAQVLDVDIVAKEPFECWTLCVADSFVKGNWTIIGYEPFASDDDAWAPPKYHYENFVERYKIWHRGVIRIASAEEVQGLELVSPRFAKGVQHMVRQRLVPQVPIRANDSKNV